MQKTSTLSPVRRKGFGTRWINQTKKRCHIWGFLCVQWPTLIIIVWDYFVFEGQKSIFLSLFSVLFSVKNKTCCLSCVCCMCDSLKKRLNKKNASSANSLRLGGHERKHIHMTSLFTTAFFFFHQIFFLASSVIALIIVEETQEQQDRLQRQSCTLTWLTNWP